LGNALSGDRVLAGQVSFANYSPSRPSAPAEGLAHFRPDAAVTERTPRLRSMAADVLWNPPLTGDTAIERFARWVSRTRGIDLPDYEALWRWSVEDVAGFWGAWFERLDLPHDGEPEPVLADASMPGAVWFPRLALNYAEAMLRMPG